MIPEADDAGLDILLI